MFTLCFTVILITIFTTLLYSENTPQLQLQGMDIALDAPMNGTIFYKDPENKLILIDFKEVNSKLTKVKLTKSDQLLMEDKVADLATDSIYEVDLNTYEKGEYTITLVTVEEKEITEQFIIK